MPPQVRWRRGCAALALPLVIAAALPAPAQPTTAATAPPRAEAPDSGWIIARLARPAPVSTPFLELRESQVLAAPLRVEGVYARPDDATLVREVRAPYAETTTIAMAGAGQATIVRSGRKPRTVALSRVPELAGLASSFGALLAGDADALERDYAATTGGSRERWRMALVPRDPRLLKQVRTITLHGRGAELRCIETTPASGALQRTLLAGAAREAAAVVDGTALARICRQDASGG